MRIGHVEIDVELPDGVSICGYERHPGALVFEIGFDVPIRCTCPQCGREAEANVQLSSDLLAIRDLDLLGLASFWVYPSPLHWCPHCRQRTQLVTPFKRPHATYTYRFEQYVMESLVGDCVEQVAQRLGISAETVELILEQQLDEQRAIPPDARITSLGFDELSLKKRRKLHLTMMSDLSIPKHPRVLGLVSGRDFEPAEKCLTMLTREQRLAVRSRWTGLSVGYARACNKWLPNTQLEIDPLSVATRLSHVVNHVRVQHAVSS